MEYSHLDRMSVRRKKMVSSGCQVCPLRVISPRLPTCPAAFYQPVRYSTYNHDFTSTLEQHFGAVQHFPSLATRTLSYGNELAVCTAQQVQSSELLRHDRLQVRPQRQIGTL